MELNSKGAVKRLLNLKTRGTNPGYQVYEKMVNRIWSFRMKRM